MEITEFTFYETYWDVIKTERDDNIRDMVIAICEFMFCGKTAEFNDLTVSLIWNEILDVLKSEREKRLSGRINHTLKWDSFTFKQSYWTMLESLNDSDRLNYIKAICVYAFEGREPKKKEVSPDVYRYFNISKLAIDLSIKRKAAGKKGGVAGRRKAVDEVEQGRDKPILTEPIERKAERRTFTIDSLEELGCRGNLNPNNPILEDVNLEELYHYVKEHPEAQKQSKYNAVIMFKNSKKKQS